MDLSGKWYVETIFPDLLAMLQVQNIIYSGRTAYQNVEVLESDLFWPQLGAGRQDPVPPSGTNISTTSPWSIPPCCRIPTPAPCLSAGGGEGGTLREALSHRSVERVVMIDLDQEVVELCRTYLPSHHQGSFDDPRVELLHQDAREYLANSRETFDVMVMDLVDPLEGGTCLPSLHDGILRHHQGEAWPAGSYGHPVRSIGAAQLPGVLHHHSQYHCRHLQLGGPLPGPRSGLPDPVELRDCLRLSRFPASVKTRLMGWLPTASTRSCGSTTPRPTAACSPCPSS